MAFADFLNNRVDFIGWRRDITTMLRMTCIGRESWLIDDGLSAVALNPGRDSVLDQGLTIRLEGRDGGPALSAVVVTAEEPWAFDPGRWPAASLAGSGSDLPGQPLWSVPVLGPPQLSVAARSALRQQGRELRCWSSGQPERIGTLQLTAFGSLGACLIQGREGGPGFLWAGGMAAGERDRSNRRLPAHAGIVCCFSERAFRTGCTCPPWSTGVHAACIAGRLLDWHRWRSLDGGLPELTLLCSPGHPVACSSGGAPDSSAGNEPALTAAGRPAERICEALGLLTGGRFAVPTAGDGWLLAGRGELTPLHPAMVAPDLDLDEPPLTSTRLRALGPLSSGSLQLAELTDLLDALARRLYGSPHFAQLYSLTPEETGARRPTLGLVVLDGSGARLQEYLPAGCRFQELQEQDADRPQQVVGLELWASDLQAVWTGELTLEVLLEKRCRQWNMAPSRITTWPSDLLTDALGAAPRVRAARYGQQWGSRGAPPSPAPSPHGRDRAAGSASAPMAAARS